jgi:hypothetical protein
MLYDSPQAWRAAPSKRITLFGMSGLGKTRLAALLREAGEWFHYSVDYRIGTKYMGEHIADNLKRHAMQVPLLAELLRSDSIYIGSNIAFENLAPLSTFLGQPGDPERGGLPFPEYMRRQNLHRRAEINALLDTPQFIARARDIYGYPCFACDTGGSICEVVDPADPRDEVLDTLARHTLLVWIEGGPDHAEELIRRFDRAPKPMYYAPDVLRSEWAAFTARHGPAPDPAAFARHAYARALRRREPIYAAMARRGVTVSSADVADARDARDATALIADALARMR